VTSPSRLHAAATALVAKLDECAPHIADAFLHRELRCGAYTGPNYAEELAVVRRALSATTGASKHAE